MKCIFSILLSLINYSSYYVISFFFFCLFFSTFLNTKISMYIFKLFAPLPESAIFVADTLPNKTNPGIACVVI